MSGGFYNILVKPGQFAFWRGDWYMVHPDFSQQTTRESMYVFLCNTSTFLGLYVIHRGSDPKRSRVSANRLLLLGIGLTFAGMSLSYYLLEMKRTPVPI